MMVSPEGLLRRVSFTNGYTQGDVITASVTVSGNDCELNFQRNGVHVGLALGPVGSLATVEVSDFFSSYKDCDVNLMVSLSDDSDEVCFAADDPHQIGYASLHFKPDPSSSAPAYSPKQLPSMCIALTAKGDVCGGVSGKEFLRNLISEGDEPWNKWVHLSAATTWIQAEFQSYPTDMCFLSGESDTLLPLKKAGSENGLQLMAYGLCSASDLPGRDPGSWRLMGRRCSDNSWIELHRYTLQLVQPRVD